MKSRFLPLSTDFTIATALVPLTPYLVIVNVVLETVSSWFVMIVEHLPILFSRCSSAVLRTLWQIVLASLLPASLAKSLITVLIPLRGPLGVGVLVFFA